MNVTPYKQPPEPIRVALLTMDERERALLLDTRGRPLDPAETEQGWRVYVSYALVGELLNRGQGEALTWNAHPTRYRTHDHGERGWKLRASDARVLRLPFPVEERRTLSGLQRWRDWLASYGAVPGSLGQASFSLLRATLERPLWTSAGQKPPIAWTLGGRQELLVERGRYAGRLLHVDLSAAYSTTLGELQYGGYWLHTRPSMAAHWGNVGLPLFLRARVSIPATVGFGPLPRRPRRQPRNPREQMILSAHYPRGTVMQGVWTHEELLAARQLGCRVRELEAWLHMPHTRPDGLGFEQPFLPWWQAVQEGRQMRGFARLLAKATGNALWGQFAMTSGRREILTLEGRGTRRRRIRRDAPHPGKGRPCSHDLTETICGRVRAQLATMMNEADGRLLCVHTDGGWLVDEPRGYKPPPGWRVTERALWLRLIDQQHLCYQPLKGPQMFVYSGVPLARAEQNFERDWRRLRLEEEGAETV